MLDDFLVLYNRMDLKKFLESQNSTTRKHFCNNQTHPANAINQEFEAQKVKLLV